MLKYLTLYSIVLAGLFSSTSYAQSSFEPLVYTPIKINKLKASSEIESCDEAKSYIQSYFKKVEDFNNELQTHLSLQAQQLIAWSKKIKVTAHKKIYYKEKSFLAFKELALQMSEVTENLEENSYTLSEDGFIILDNVISECIPEASDDLLNDYENLISKRLDIETTFLEYITHIKDRVETFYSSIQSLEKETNYFAEEYLLNLESLNSSEEGFPYGLQLYKEIVEVHQEDEKKIIEAL